MSEEKSQANAQVLQAQYNKYQEDISSLQTQVGNFTSQIQEHLVVDKTLTAIEPSARKGRKCFKMIGGVLVEKSVDDVIKILNDDMKVLNETKATMEKSLKDTRAEMEKWIKNNNVKIMRQN